MPAHREMRIMRTDNGDDRTTSRAHIKESVDATRRHVPHISRKGVTPKIAPRKYPRKGQFRQRFLATLKPEWSPAPMPVVQQATLWRETHFFRGCVRLDDETSHPPRLITGE